MKGRPPKYEPKMLKQAEKLVRLGVTEAVLADFFDVDVATFRRWKHRYPDLRAVVEKGKLMQDAEVASSLYNRAKGMKIRAVKIFYDADKMARAEAVYYAEYQRLTSILQDGEPGSTRYEEALEALQNLKAPTDEDGIVRAPYIEHLAPDTGSMVFYLKNRQPDLWKDKREVSGNVGSEIKHVIEWAPAEGCAPLLTDDELREMEASDEKDRHGDSE